ncbi:uncharacterized protein [Amphiura filiformis]|uniref:uncharacterized protein n=1 Tax=Amphiura filiformis TaxID=82378 RepID=UPI003B227204
MENSASVRMKKIHEDTEEDDSVLEKDIVNISKLRLDRSEHDQPLKQRSPLSENSTKSKYKRDEGRKPDTLESTNVTAEVRQEGKTKSTRRKTKIKPKSKRSGSLILKIRKVDSAVDIATFRIYLKKKQVKFANIDFKDCDDDSDEETNEATLYFSSEGDALAAEESLLNKCAIGEEGAEAEVILEEIDEPYQRGPEVEAKDKQAKDSKPAKQKPRQRKKKEKEKDGAEQMSGPPRGNHANLPNQGYMYQAPPPNMPPGQHPYGQQGYMNPGIAQPYMPQQPGGQFHGPPNQHMFTQPPNRYQYQSGPPPLLGSMPFNYGMQQPATMPGNQRPPLNMNYMGQPPNQGYRQMGPPQNPSYTPQPNYNVPRFGFDPNQPQQPRGQMSTSPANPVPHQRHPRPGHVHDDEVEMTPKHKGTQKVKGDISSGDVPKKSGKQPPKAKPPKQNRSYDENTDGQWNPRASGGNTRERQKNPNQRGNKPSRAKQMHDQLKMLESETPEAKVSRMLQTGGTLMYEENQSNDAMAGGAAADNDDNDSIMSGLSSVSRGNRHQSNSHGQSKPSSTCLRVTGFDSSTRWFSFEQFLKEHNVPYVRHSFRGASNNQQPYALVDFETTRDTANGKKAIHGAIMKSSNGTGSMLKAQYQWDDGGKRRSGNGTGSAADNRSEVGSTISTQSTSSQQLSSSLEITGIKQGIDPVALSNFLQEQKDNLKILNYEFNKDGKGNTYALLNFNVPKDCSRARSILHGKPLAMNGSNIKATYPKRKPIPPVADHPAKPSEATGVGRGSSGSSRQPTQRSNDNHDGQKQTSNRSKNKPNQNRWYVDVTAIDESVDEEDFKRFLRRKRIRPNNVKWSTVKGPSPSNRANLDFANNEEATAAQSNLDGCLLGEGEMVAIVKMSKGRRNRRRLRHSSKGIDNDVNDDDNDDASSDISSVLPLKNDDNIRRKQRLGTSVNVRNIDPDVDEDDFREFLLCNLEDFSELQFFPSKRCNNAIIKFDTPEEARIAKDKIQGNCLARVGRDIFNPL